MRRGVLLITIHGDRWQGDYSDFSESTLFRTTRDMVFLAKTMAEGTPGSMAVVVDLDALPDRAETHEWFQ